ncbi:hypothetical protein ACFKKA_01295 [Streptococcus agalactiae]|uniref:hypothetical protein n=1 Tax=Streptococcus agalactiae TaxID=1311 RepID=UPI00362D7F7E
MQEAKSQKAQAEKKKQDKTKKSESQIEKDKAYQKAKEAAARADKVYAKKKPTSQELEQAEKDSETVRKFTENNKQYETTKQYAELKQTVTTHDNDSADLTNEALEREYLDNYLANARKATDPGKMSKLTSYIYVEDGFFGTKDMFPKAVNALVQGLFFLPKALYILVIIVLGQLFSGNAYSQLDTVVETSTTMFNTIMVDYRYAVFGLALTAGLVEMYRHKRFPFSIFKFGFVWALALFLYSPASLPDYGDADIPAKYNLSRLIKAVDGAGSAFTVSAITSFDTLDTENKSVSEEGSDLSTVKEVIFDQMVYEPFIAMNFSDDKGNISEDKIKELIKTNGIPNKVEEYYKNNKKIARMSFGDIGMKFLVALASVAKALILGIALIGLGLLSLVFKYLAMILLVVFVLVLLIAMLPGFEHVLGGVFKKIIQFVFIGSLGLFFIRAFLYVNSLIEGMAQSMSTFYFWSALIQGVIWVMIYGFRHVFLGMFIRGTINAQEIGRKAQNGLNRITSVPLSQTMNGFKKPQTITRTVPNDIPSYQESLSPRLTSDEGVVKPSRFGTLKRASYNVAGTVGHQLKTDYDNLRFGDNKEARVLNEQKHLAREQRREDIKADLAYIAAIPKFYGLRSKIHDLAGDEGTTSQEIFQARQSGRDQRKQFRRNGYRHFQPSVKPNLVEHLELPKTPEKKMKQPSFLKKTEKEGITIPKQSSPVEPFTSDDLFQNN